MKDESPHNVRRRVGLELSTPTCELLLADGFRRVVIPKPEWGQADVEILERDVDGRLVRIWGDFHQYEIQVELRLEAPLPEKRMDSIARALLPRHDAYPRFSFKEGWLVAYTLDRDTPSELFQRHRGLERMALAVRAAEAVEQAARQR